MRLGLKLLRVKLNLTQEEMAKKLNVNRGTYIAIENGRRDGRLQFWENLQKSFDIPDENMWALMKHVEEE
ncbi:MAG: helix-turn-helix domain-containing protein [Clostridia bacterium]|nr:helix-turn-helix domain-containing protein [Clostridia bacterium]